jgi:hypothetical protein
MLHEGYKMLMLRSKIKNNACGVKIRVSMIIQIKLVYKDFNSLVKILEAMFLIRIIRVRLQFIPSARKTLKIVRNNCAGR